MKSIKELFKDYKEIYEKEVINWGEPVGKEIIEIEKEND